MALTRVKTWISEILTAADLNAEFNNILNNATSLISPATAAWDMDGKELILDADADTSITADTDDQIDFKLSGTDTVRMTAAGLTMLAGDVNFTAGAMNTARATVASAATTADIWAANGNQIDWTGTTTCTGFPAAPQAGVSRTLICAAAAPFTAGANMLIDGVTSGSTVTCAANDKMIVEAVTTTQFRLSRVRYDGHAQLAGLVLLQTVTATASSTVDLETGIGANYDNYVVVASGVRPSATALLACRLKVGGTYLTASYIFHSNLSNSSVSTYTGSGSSSNSYIVLSEDLNQSVADSNLSFTMEVFDANNAALAKQVAWIGSSFDSNVNRIGTAFGAGGHITPGALTGVRFLPATGTISGTFRLYGRSQS